MDSAVWTSDSSSSRVGLGERKATPLKLYLTIVPATLADPSLGPCVSAMVTLRLTYTCGLVNALQCHLGDS